MRAIILALALIGVVGCGTKSQDDKPSATKMGPMTREAFEVILKDCKDGNDVMAKFGRPARTVENDIGEVSFVMVYESKTMNPVTGKTDPAVYIKLDGKDVNGPVKSHRYH
jgi:hypothetical protein